MRRRTTLKDVAEQAGVHISTVSRALNPRTRHLITPEVAAAIDRVSARLDYRPNAAASSLRTNRTRSIGVVVPDIANPVFPPIIRGIEDALASQGYLAILANTDGHLDREAKIAAMLRARGVDGLILASVEREDRAISLLAAEGLPIVTVNRRVDDPAVSSVVNDEEDGIRRILAHLVELGHRAIANIAGPQSLSTGVERYEAFEVHRRALPLAPDPALVVFAAAFNEAEGDRCTDELLRRGAPLSAVVCSNDRLAIGAIAALRRHGLECPRDLSVTGYNDMPLVDRLSPALTTVRIQQYEVGRAAADVLLDAIETPPERREPRHIVRPVELVVRSSTGVPAQRQGLHRRTRDRPA
ncbi:MAG: LacI family transcriptional regulator [Bauldia sp.]|nr:LacI family transcriptional regulator [Bauldia sp.]